MYSLRFTLGSSRPSLLTTDSTALVGPSPHRRRHRRYSSRRSPPVTAFKEEEERKPIPSSPSTFLIPAFALQKEHFFGRLASLGLAFSMVGEALTGLGPFAQLSLETGLSTSVLYFAALGIVVWQLVGGLLLPGSNVISTPWNIGELERVKLGSDGGGGKRRVKMGRGQVMIGRMAMLGFAGASVVEWLWKGEGALNHLGLIVRGGGVPLIEAPLWFTVIVGVLLINAAGLFGGGE